MLSSKVCHIVRMGMATNFKLGTQMEHEDTDTDKRHKLQGQRSKSQGNVLRLSV